MSDKEFDIFREKLKKGLEKAYKKMVAQKRLTNSPIIVSKNGKVIKLDPHEAPSTTTYR